MSSETVTGVVLLGIILTPYAALLALGAAVDRSPPLRRSLPSRFAELSRSMVSALMIIISAIVAIDLTDIVHNEGASEVPLYAGWLLGVAMLALSIYYSTAIWWDVRNASTDRLESIAVKVSFWIGRMTGLYAEWVPRRILHSFHLLQSWGMLVFTYMAPVILGVIFTSPDLLL